ncbi:hypothetical protein [Christiangramia forsetii]|uniref:Uncharacterized protein n=2 Tax=Christiangramia forsetii TaxID=411153 RepID=A0M202_CHRFK|nr:hypothetical protein [Christiangramia forsetii]GGG44928.1 hypothetical protein GCM10011532_31100 [Christiangramia forsetii]CAL66647.1 hypothetical protein GFO_1676 [Christiangramia forsetii KT0803]
MKAKDSIHVARCLNRLKEKYKLNATEVKQLKDLEECEVTSIAFTENGGFDRRNGEFYPEDRECNYKIRIKYREKDTDPEKILVLMPVYELQNIRKPILNRTPLSR